MNISKKDLEDAIIQQLLSAEQAQKLWAIWEERDRQQPKFDFAHVAYYFGAILAISAMTWFMTEAWEAYGGAGIFTIATLYAICFGIAGYFLWNDPPSRIPGGLLFTLMVCMVPLAVYGLEREFDFWPQGDPGGYQDFYIWVKGSWFIMEVATILAAAITLIFIRFPFLTAPIAFALWYMSMDLTPLLVGQNEFSWDNRLWISLWFGLVMILIAYFVDRRTREDYAFWLYLFGLIAFWGGLSLMKSDSELGKFLYFLINLGIIFLSIFLQRRTFIVFGVTGAFGYIGYLAFHVFQNSLLFPVILTVAGLAIIYIGVLYHRYHAQLEHYVLGHLPMEIKALMPANR